MCAWCTDGGGAERESLSEYDSLRAIATSSRSENFDYTLSRTQVYLAMWVLVYIWRAVCVYMRGEIFFTVMWLGYGIVCQK